MSKGKNEQGASGPDSALGPGAPAPDVKLQTLPPDLSDFEPKGAVAHSYPAYRQQDGFSERALFIIDAQGVIRWSYLSPLEVNPGADGVFDALQALDSKREVAV